MNNIQKIYENYGEYDRLIQKKIGLKRSFPLIMMNILIPLKN